jgi:hypothetical protein
VEEAQVSLHLPETREEKEWWYGWAIIWVAILIVFSLLPLMT